MAKVFKAAKSTGAVSITNSGNPSAITDPLNNLEDVFFHTDLDYVQIKSEIPAVQVTLPFVPREFINYDDGDCGGSCFITTAVVGKLGMSDDCYELGRLRYFRDAYMRKHYPDLVDAYYQSAPALARTLNTMDIRLSLKLFTDYIEPAVRYIEAGDMEECLTTYKNMLNFAAAEVANAV